VVICLERGANLHMAQLMPLPLTVSCSSKIHIGFTFLVPAYPGYPGKEAVEWLLLLPVAVARSSSGGVAIRRVLPVSLMTLCFVNGPYRDMSIPLQRRRCSVLHRLTTLLLNAFT